MGCIVNSLLTVCCPCSKNGSAKKSVLGITAITGTLGLLSIAIGASLLIVASRGKMLSGKVMVISGKVGLGVGVPLTVISGILVLLTMDACLTGCYKGLKERLTCTTGEDVFFNK